MNNPYMITLVGGTLIDGTGAPARHADVVIAGDKIAAVVAPGGGPRDGERIDCSGLTVSPGFIDLHTHSDLTRLQYPSSDTRILQGVTTEVIGNCGMSPFPALPDVERLRSLISVIDICPDLGMDWADTEAYLERLDDLPAGTNVAVLVGHGVLREVVASRGLDPATSSGRLAMANDLRGVLADGVFGVSLGLMYPPGEQAHRDELLSVAGVVAEHDSLLSAHMRSYAAEELEVSVAEMIDIARASGARVQMSHLRSIRDNDAEGIAAALRLLDSGPSTVQADLYPYLAGHTTALQLFPPELRALGADAAIAVVHRDSASITDHLRRRSVVDPSRITLAKPPRAELVGANLASLASELNAEWANLLIDLFVEGNGNLDVIVVGSTMADMLPALANPRVSIASDGVALAISHRVNLAHPRSIGTFPRAIRVLTEYGLPLPEIVRKATSQPAGRLGITDRGTVAPGMHADLVVFDPCRIADNATYTSPLEPPSGIEHVIVNGKAVVVDGTITGTLPGRLLRRPKTDMTAQTAHRCGRYSTGRAEC